MINTHENWQSKLKNLITLAEKNQGISIGKKGLSIPESERDQFFRFQEDIKQAFIKQHFSEDLKKILDLKDQFANAVKSIFNSIPVERITAGEEFDAFIKSPESELSRHLSLPLMELLRGDSDIVSFYEESHSKMTKLLNRLYIFGYRNWIVLELVRLFSVEKVLEVPIPKPTAHQLVKYTSVTKKPPPIAVESDSLSLLDVRYPVFCVPDFIIRSSSCNQYVSFKSDFKRPHWVCGNYPDFRSWLDLNSVETPILPRLLLIYISPNANDISLLADMETISQPDFSIYVHSTPQCFDSDLLKKIHDQNLRLQPKFGSYIVTEEPLTTEPEELHNNGIRLLYIGFEPNKLQPIVDSIS